MLVEEHPKYEDWSAAFDRRNDAEWEYRAAVMLKEPEAEVAAKKADYDRAQAAYDSICDTLD